MAGQPVNKEMRQLVKKVRELGYEVVHNNGGHFRVMKDGKVLATLASTPKGGRGITHAKADLRRAGVAIPH